MAVRRKALQSGKSAHLGEENLALEIAEDKRLLRLGINPDSDPIQIMLQVSRLAKAFNDEAK